MIKIKKGSDRMLEELNISMTIDVVNKILYIGEESSSGAEYNYKDIKDLEDKIGFYLENYYSNEIENQNDNNLEELEDDEETI